MKRITVVSTITTLFVICFIIIILTGKHCDECFSMPAMMAKFFACGLVIFIGSIYFTRLYLKYEKIMFSVETIPLLETNEATEGIPFSCEGTVVFDKQTVLSSPYTNMPCVYYHSIREELQGSGRSRHWVVVGNLVGLVPFYISDARGKLKIDPANLDSDFSGYKIDVARYIPDPENSEIDCTPVLNKERFNSSTVRRSEYILPPLAKVFTYGYLVKKNGELALQEYGQYPLIISQKTKDAYVNEFYKGHNLVFLVHLLMSMGFTVSLLSANYFLQLDTVILVYLIIGINWLIVVSIFFTIYNRLITLLQRAQYALKDIDIELARRSELIPEIMELAKEYSRYEQELQQVTAQMRAHTVFLKELPEGQYFNTAPLTAILEKYPSLHASESFKSLMLSLIDTEERIAYARAFYNRNVRKLNTLVKQFPFIIVAYLCSIGEMRYVSIASDE